MIDIAVLKAMAAAGATVDVIIAAVDAAQQAEQREMATRRAKDAERKRMSRGHGVTSADMNGHPRSRRDKRKVSTPSKENTSVSNETAPSPEKELFRRGKEVLGQNAGGMISDLLKAKNREVPLARAAIETASTKQNPREYIGGVIRGATNAQANFDDWRTAIA